ncbi:MAG: type I-F CRISPR-associated helicase Cas3f [bacterium]
MMVTFVSQCEKKALNKTRRVLDAFANRIGSRTWQTVITNEGLQAVKKLLRKTASKNTAVSCHWARSRSRTELVWIVGNRAKFNAQGIVPVNSTRKTIMNTQWENDWRYLPLIKALAALSALFHDWGKASAFFQTKLKQGKILADPLRHEWISMLFLRALVNSEDDAAWLSRLIEGDYDESRLKEIALHQVKKPLAELPSAASLICWLVLSHHRLPVLNMNEGRRWRGQPAETSAVTLKRITQEWGYENRREEAEYQRDVARCFDFEMGLPNHSPVWVKQARKWARKLQDCLPLIQQAMEDGSWRVILNHARLSLMLGDHYYSSCPRDEKWHSHLNLYANTDRKSGALKQQLDEHLVGVATNALKTAHLLPAFEGKEGELPRVFDIKALKRKSPPKFRWQDTAVTRILDWRKTQAEPESAANFGFFAVNMASTGKGKTFANAKIMRALSPEQDSLRFILALGLRTLTLQTGDEYRHRIGLDESELGVLIGSRAVMDLHQHHQHEVAEKSRTLEESGSESLESLIDNEVHYESEIPEEILSTVLANDANRERNKKFLYAPVLACTIDHMMAATETIRGGRYMLPSLRLMSSDLVIDEIDDFDGKDLVAIGRLIHLAGMLGRKVMISSATIPPDLAEGYFNAYQAGWSLFAKTREVRKRVGCAWIDEFTTQVKDISGADDDQKIASFKEAHEHFVGKRIRSLKKQPPKRKAEIIAIAKDQDEEPVGEESLAIETLFYQQVLGAVVEQHRRHHTVDPLSQKNVSFGVVRVANVPPCIALTRFLAEAQWPEDHEVRVMAYHSQQVMLMRSIQERHLDKVLKRDPKKSLQMFEDATIKGHLDQCNARNLIFILVATPVEEVGRDHDFDWAVIEPSSFRSIIQLAGRVLRHREEAPETPNLALLQYNLKALKGKENAAAYCRPGYESAENRLASHDLTQLLDTKAIARCVDAKPRIRRKKLLDPLHSLADLEHHSIHQLLTRYEERGPEAMEGWLVGNWWMTGLPQRFNPFREGGKQQLIYLLPEDDQCLFVEKDSTGNINVIDRTFNIERVEMGESERARLWLYRDYPLLLEALAESMGMSMRRAALTYGELALSTYGKDPLEMKYSYSDQLGMTTKH